jgi:predicted nucleic acid-binding protein
MLYYLDTVIVVYAVEGNPADQQRTLQHLAKLEHAGHRFAISELTLTECLVPVFGPGDGQRLSDFFRFFNGPNLRTLGLTTAIHTRASAIRGGHKYPTAKQFSIPEIIDCEPTGHPVPTAPPAPPRRYGLADALHLATAIEFGCDVFLTNDNQLSSFPDITVEELPRP